VEASAEMVGKKMYCPVCYFEITVPAESTIKPVDESQLYAIDSVPIDVREMTDRHKFVSLRCPICRTNIAVSQEQIEKIIVCPDCETKVRVPVSIAGKFKQIEKEWNQRINQQTRGEQYSVPIKSDSNNSGDIYAVSGDNTVAAKPAGENIRVYCKLCGTMMYASESQIGMELTCPDCETKTVVPAKRKSVPPPLPINNSFEGGKIFGIADSDRDNKNQNQNQNLNQNQSRIDTSLLVPVVCNLCGTRMYAYESEIGGFKICPDCGRQNEIKPVPKSEKIQAGVVKGGGYSVAQLNESDKRPVIRTLVDYRYVEDYDAKLKVSVGSKVDSERSAGAGAGISRNIVNQFRINADNVPKLPKYPFVSKIFVSFADRMLWGRMIYSLILMIFGIIIIEIFAGLLLVIVGWLGITAIVFGLLYHADTFYTLFFCTLMGGNYPESEDWREFKIVDFGSLTIWLFILVIFSSFPMYCCISLFLNGRIGLLDLQVIAANEMILTVILLFGGSMLFFFPIFFLSCIENNASFLIFGRVICYSLISCIGVWFRFYFISFLISLIFGLLIYMMITVVSQYIFWNMVTPIFVIFSMIYARYLGRLGWTIEERTKSNYSKKQKM
jgi:DNA-directed RNA polymerase subunit M/transcription elongation factor TFIIS